jgi:hypothetical protein
MVGDGPGRPLTFLSPGQMNDAKNVLVLLAQLPPANRLLGDKGYAVDWLRDEPKDRGLRIFVRADGNGSIPPGITSGSTGSACCIENAFARLKDWRTLPMRYTR